MSLRNVLRRCLFPEAAFRWYSRLPPDDLRARLHSVQPAPAVRPSFRRIGEGYHDVYLWVGMEEPDFTMVVRRLAPATSPELRLTGRVSAHGRGSILAGAVQGGLTEQIAWIVVRLGVLLSATSWLLENTSTQSGQYYFDASAVAAWLMVVAAVAAAPFIQFSFLCGNLLPKVQGRFLAVAYPEKR